MNDDNKIDGIGVVLTLCLVVLGAALVCWVAFAGDTPRGAPLPAVKCADKVTQPGKKDDAKREKQCPAPEAPTTPTEKPNRTKSPN